MNDDKKTSIYLVPAIPNLSILDEWLPVVRHLRELQPEARFFSVLDMEWKAREPLDPKFDLVVLSESLFDGCIVRRVSGKTLVYDSLGKAGRAEQILESRIFAPPGLRAIIRLILHLSARVIGSIRTQGKSPISESDQIIVLSDPDVWTNLEIRNFFLDLGCSQFYLLPHGAGWK